MTQPPATEAGWPLQPRFLLPGKEGEHREQLGGGGGKLPTEVPPPGCMQTFSPASGDFSPGRDCWSLGCQPFEFWGGCIWAASQSCPGSASRCAVVRQVSNWERWVPAALSLQGRGRVSEMEELIRSPAGLGGSRADRSLALGAEAREEAQECRQGRCPSLALGPLILREVHAWPPGGSAPSRRLPVGRGCSGAAGRCSLPPRAPASVSQWPCLFPLELQVSA